MRRGRSVEAVALIGLLLGLVGAGARSLQIVDFNLFIVLLLASIASVLGLFHIAARLDRPDRK